MRFILLFSFISILSCTTEEIKPKYKEYISGTSDILYNIDVSPAGKVTIIGGYVWSRGLSLLSDGDLTKWELDTFSTKGQFDLLRTSRNELVTVGTDGFFFIKKDADRKWTFHRLQNWDILHSVIETPTGFMAAGGKSYETGYLYIIDSTYNIDIALYFGHEISDIVRVKDSVYLTVGWGNIQRSEDNGRTWKLLPNEGDFYASCVFLDEEHGFVIGYNGTLLETTNGGSSWSKSASELAGSGFNSYRKLKITQDKSLFITGNNGKLWRSTDLGKTWQFYVLNQDIDIYDIAISTNGSYILVGSKGWIGELVL